MDVNVRLRWFAFCCAWCALAGAFSLASGEEKGESWQRWNPDSLLVSESLTKNGHLPIVTVQVAGKDYRFLVYTSEFLTRLDTSLCSGLKPFRLKDRDLPAEAQGWLQPPAMNIGPRKLDWIYCVKPLDCRLFSKQCGERIHGVLGMEVLRELVLQIDADNDVFQIAAPSPLELPPGIHLPLEIDEASVPKLLCSIAPGKSASFEIDTSCYENGSVDQSCADEIAKIGGHLLHDRRAIQTANGKFKKMDAIRTPSIGIGTCVMRNLEISVEETNRLGMDALVRINPAFDFKNRRVYVRPSKLIDCEDRQMQVGLVFDTDKPPFTVKDVHVGLAADAGIKIGDRIVHVNGFPADAGIWKAHRSLYTPSLSATNIELDRAGKRIVIKLPSDR